MSGSPRFDLLDSVLVPRPKFQFSGAFDASAAIGSRLGADLPPHRCISSTALDLKGFYGSEPRRRGTTASTSTDTVAHH